LSFGEIFGIRKLQSLSCGVLNCSSCARFCKKLNYGARGRPYFQRFTRGRIRIIRHFVHHSPVLNYIALKCRPLLPCPAFSVIFLHRSERDGPADGKPGGLVVTVPILLFDPHTWTGDLPLVTETETISISQYTYTGSKSDIGTATISH